VISSTIDGFLPGILDGYYGFYTAGVGAGAYSGYLNPINKDLIWLNSSFNDPT